MGRVDIFVGFVPIYPSSAHIEFQPGVHWSTFCSISTLLRTEYGRSDLAFLEDSRSADVLVEEMKLAIEETKNDVLWVPSYVLPRSMP